ncbi:patatin-like phospholipase family protein [Chiayiivirga flava]|uniref:Putative acylesterase/phospholipase RssA n=1 Tax=Chiayiivirga flava TaxID=659595 RepID=A0A7W8D4V6_9GAMM|nr:patatin-like phospholipase family protein [Chiayiivirga flava]MBB5206716.1 putative acylesterase/phospholipase RssA [Chiayiivirga flava]
MLLFQPSTRPRASRGKIGLAIAGGGPIGGMYELGALRALDEAIEGLDLNDLAVYVGVSSGAFLAAGLANRISTEQMCRIFITGDPDDVPFRPEAFLRPAFAEYGKRMAAMPRVLLGWWRDLLLHPRSIGISDAMQRFGDLVPTGLFDNAAVERFLRDAYSRHGRTNDFRELKRKLYVVAVDIDSGEAVRFGSEGWDDVPISRAVQASAALPALYPPVDIRGRQFVDGALRRTMHASVAFDSGVDLFIGLNPLVPIDNASARRGAKGKYDNLSRGGLPMVLSQTFRTLLQSRMQVGMTRHAQQYDDVDQLVFEPNPSDGEMFFTNIFSYSARQHLCEHAYRNTLDDLSARRAELAPVFARHGLRLRVEVLDDPARSLTAGLGEPAYRQTDATASLRRALDDVAALVRQRRAERG